MLRCLLLVQGKERFSHSATQRDFLFLPECCEGGCETWRIWVIGGGSGVDRGMGLRREGGRDAIMGSLRIQLASQKVEEADGGGLGLC